MSERTVLTGVGVISALGEGWQALLEGLVSGRPPFSSRRLGSERLGELPPLYAAYVDDFDAARLIGKKGLRNLGRESRLFMSAAAMACRAAGLDPATWDRSRVGTMVASLHAGLEDYVEFFTDALVYGADRVNPSLGARTGFNAPASQLAIRFGTEAANVTVVSGQASGLDALAYAASYVRSGRVGTFLVGGVEVLSYYPARALLAAEGDERPASSPPRPFDRERRGLVPGEAGVAFVLEAYGDARRRGAPMLAEVRGVGSAFRPRASRAALADAARGAMTEALAAAGGAEVGAAVASASGDRLLDACEAEALSAILGDRIWVSAIKGATGDCLGAGGALAIAAALGCFEQGWLAPATGFRRPDPELPPLRIARRPVELRPSSILVHSLDRRGFASALVLGAC